MVSRTRSRGPHDVQVGDLSVAGVAGKVYVPASGQAVPGMVFVHDWATHASAYHGFFKLLASWGVAVAALDTQTGLLPDTDALVKDVARAATVLVSAPLGEGRVTVHPERLVLAGHGLGASVAALAATPSAQARWKVLQGVRSVIALFPQVTHPKASSVASTITVPALILGPGQDAALRGLEAMRMAHHWKAACVYREVADTNLGIVLDSSVRPRLLGLGKQRSSIRSRVRALVVAYALGSAVEKSSADEFRVAMSSDPLKGFEVKSAADLFTALPENQGEIKDFSEKLTGLVNSHTA